MFPAFLCGLVFAGAATAAELTAPRIVTCSGDTPLKLSVVKARVSVGGATFDTRAYSTGGYVSFLFFCCSFFFFFFFVLCLRFVLLSLLGKKSHFEARPYKLSILRPSWIYFE
jgi:hypothetical protein